MVFDDKKLGRVFPTRTGTPQGAGAERVMLSQPGAGSIRTQMRTTPDGEVMLRTRNGMPEFSTTEKLPTTAATGGVLDWYDACVAGGEFYTPELTTVAAVSFTNTTATKYGFVAGDWVLSTRLAVPLSNSLPSPYDAGTGRRYSQLSEVKPYFYTGTMRKLVQLCLGIGKVHHKSWYERNYKLPAGCKSAYRDGEAASIKFNYRYNSTDGVGFGPDGTPWLIWISQTNGVWAFLLPREPGTETAAFQTLVAGDPDAALVCSTFKGFPTGESHQDSELDEWVKSGCGMQLIEPAAMPHYLSGSAMGEQLGWAFNYSGTEARVTGVIEHVGTGVDYKSIPYQRVAITYGAVRAVDPSPIVAAVQAQYMSAVQHKPALRAKLLYLSEAQALEVSAGGLPKLQEITVAPIAAHTAGYTLLSNLPCAAGRGQFKVWSDAAGMCVSPQWPATGIPALTDSVLSVYFSGDEAVELKLSYGSSTLAGGPYTQQYSTQGSNEASHTSVSDTGVQIRQIINDAAHYDPGSDKYDLWFRTWSTLQTITTTVTTGNSAKGAAIIPYGDRESVVLAKYAAHTGGSVSVHNVRGTTQEARSYWISWGFVIGGGPDADGNYTGQGCTVPYNTTFIGNPVVPAAINPTAIVDSGDWVSPCMPITGLGIDYGDPDAALTDTSTGTGPHAEFEAVVQSSKTVKTIKKDGGDPTATTFLYDVWFKPSGPADDDHLTMRTSRTCFGPTDSIQCYDDLNSGTYLIFGTTLHAEQKGYQFSYTGVV